MPIEVHWYECINGISWRGFLGLRCNSVEHCAVQFLGFWVQSERHSHELSARASYKMCEKFPLKNLCEVQKAKGESVRKYLWVLWISNLKRNRVPGYFFSEAKWVSFLWNHTIKCLGVCRIQLGLNAFVAEPVPFKSVCWMPWEGSLARGSQTVVHWCRLTSPGKAVTQSSKAQGQGEHGFRPTWHVEEKHQVPAALQSITWWRGSVSHLLLL